MNHENKEKIIPLLRTLKSDAELYARQQKLSQLDVVAHQYQAQKPLSQNNLSFLGAVIKVILIAVVIVALIVIGYFFFQTWFVQGEPKIPTTLVMPRSFVNVESQETISFVESDPGSLVRAIHQARAKGNGGKNVTYYPIEVKRSLGDTVFITAQEFSQFLGWKPPDSFVENLEGGFNLFIVGASSDAKLVVMMRVQNFEGTFDAMLRWEKTLWLDWKPFLDETDIQNIGQFSFEDEVVSNHDARLLKNKEGKSIMAYTFFNKNFLVVALSRDALALILDRLIILPPR